MINVYISGIKHAWRYIFFFVHSSLFLRGVTQNIFCVNISFTSGLWSQGWKALTGSWLEMNVSFTNNLQDEWLTILGSLPFCWDPQSVLFFIFIFHFHFLCFASPSTSFYHLSFSSLFFPFSICPPCSYFLSPPPLFPAWHYHVLTITLTVFYSNH